MVYSSTINTFTREFKSSQHYFPPLPSTSNARRQLKAQKNRILDSEGRPFGCYSPQGKRVGWHNSRTVNSQDTLDQRMKELKKAAIKSRQAQLEKKSKARSENSRISTSEDYSSQRPLGDQPRIRDLPPHFPQPMKAIKSSHNDRADTLTPSSNIGRETTSRSTDTVVNHHPMYSDRLGEEEEFSRFEPSSPIGGAGTVAESCYDVLDTTSFDSMLARRLPPSSPMKASPVGVQKVAKKA
ncbi:uncharacterized protein IL334_004047 [Kwoniella shivajii]|uniref:Uncharacterized protein n=1 Tax=Kwoniella shivajii TaxID=564305 RepID=A0ABZ1CZN5_9TREE|nr:hypothetical protein IL334_004047 [Kwoniella shivajii]